MYRPRALALVAIGLAISVLTACGGLSAEEPGGTDSTTGGYTALRTGKDATTTETDALAALPASVKDSYDGFWHSTRLGPSPYANWTPPKAPWKFCYSSAYQGNSWRAEGLTVARNIVAQLQTQNLVDGDLVVADANNNASVQATQVTTMVQQGCQVIFAMQPPSVGMCNAFDNANKAGALVVVMQTGTECTNVIQSDFAQYATGAKAAEWLVRKSGGKGTVVMCDGIPGVAAAEARQAAAAAVFQKAGLKVDRVTGEWTPSTIKSQMLSYLSTHAGEVAGVWDGGVCAVAVTEAFQQAGRTLPYVSGFEGGCAWLASWKRTGKESIGFTQGGGQGVVEAFKVALRLLAGQKSTVNTLLYPLPEINASNFTQYYKPQMTLNSGCNAQPLDGESVPDSYYDALFTGDAKPATFTAGLGALPIK
ncbi:monosaccharide ABC transporter substrate-binding protein, CUT2 family [Cryptosporangium arvum DSM 44712]|uniref:Monosaccharide ABC transporter substrate-binding protein, CUT2 family n=1 Tax=Cryptosporangium arvum DSM 44712 TaxID=927661 RepID=A0A010YQN0_9ACTN|nr:monosaccharide ABC transporter substrate-binding protein, CUT2 family [Cryptosporangium arvum DSM 44712]